MDPIIGALVSAAFSGVFGSVAQARANRYNSPAQQRKRLRKAGLPLAYMYSGNVGQQSEVPRLSIDPDLGASESKRLKQEKYLLDAQVPKLNSERKFQDFVNELKKLDVQWNKLFPDQTSGDSINRWRMLEAEKAIAQSEAFIKENTGRLTEISKEVEDALLLKGTQEGLRGAQLAKVRQEVVNLVKQSDLMDQLKDIRSLEQLVNESINENVKNMPEWFQGIWSMLMKLFSQSAGR